MCYHCSYISPTNSATFSLKSQVRYLEIILGTHSITSDMVFSKEDGQKYFQSRNILLNKYDQGLLKPMPVCHVCFQEKEISPIDRIMVVVTCPNGENITDNDPDGFGHT